MRQGKDGVTVIKTRGVNRKSRRAHDNQQSPQDQMRKVPRTSNPYTPTAGCPVPVLASARTGRMLPVGIGGRRKKD
jgi:hypothetical protein